MEFNRFEIFEYKSKWVEHPQFIIESSKKPKVCSLIHEIVNKLEKKAEISIIAPLEFNLNDYKDLSDQHYDIDYDDDIKTLLNPEVRDEKIVIIFLKGFTRRHAINATQRFSVNLTELLMNGRHYNITTICVNNIDNVGINPSFRLNFDYIYLDYSIGHRKLYMNYAVRFLTEEVFSQILAVFNDDKFMVIDNRSFSDSIQEKMFWYKCNDWIRLFEEEMDLTRDFDELRKLIHSDRIIKLNIVI